MAKKIKLLGRCKLTGDEGEMVKSHIIPKALTYRDSKYPFVQSGDGTIPVMRWDSWYDTELVTQAGETILRDLDTWAVTALRGAKLVWRSWETRDQLEVDDHTVLPDRHYGVRNVRGLDGQRLRLFLLSVLWRAAASQRSEFREIQLRHSDLRRLRQMVVTGRIEPHDFFPVTLTQLSSRGEVHNLAPLAQTKLRDVLNPNKGASPIFRFYFDGLIAHFHRQMSLREVEGLRGIVVGTDEETIVSTVTYERSWERENMTRLMQEALTDYPEQILKIPGFRPGD